MSKPIIGITCDFDTAKATKKGMKRRDRYYLSRAYVQSVINAGGIPILLGGAKNSMDIQKQLELLDGLLLTGGSDHNPQLYGNKKHPKTHLMHTVRQQYEIETARLALKSKLPILGICLGCQTLNVASSGSLIQDIPSQVKTDIPHSQKKRRSTLTHWVNIDKKSRLFHIVKRNKIQTNSFHHQAIKRVGNRFLPVACADDKVIEAIELDNRRFVLGVQWHPEELIAHQEHLAIFKALVDAARGKSI